MKNFLQKYKWELLEYFNKFKSCLYKLGIYSIYLFINFIVSLCVYFFHLYICECYVFPEYYDFFRWMAFGWFLYTNYILLLICLFLFQCGKIFGFWI